jgi:hypothetical protein
MRVLPIAWSSSTPTSPSRAFSPSGTTLMPGGLVTVDEVEVYTYPGRTAGQ